MGKDINTIGIVGLGLMGASLSYAFREKRYLLYGIDISEDALALSADSGLFDGLTDSIEEFLEFPLDLIYICLPVSNAIAFIKELGKREVKTLVTDASSTKVSIGLAAGRYKINYCGGHPVTGKESSGFINADKNILKKSFHILVGKDSELRKGLKILHEDIGMKVIFMNAEIHDSIFSLNSHMPHLVAFTLIELVCNINKNALDFTGAGFKDFTRIAGSNPKMWTDIFSDNNVNIVELIDNYILILENWRKLLTEKKYKKIYEKISEISKVRKSLI